jgi:fructose-bisphosphate aldolase class II
MHGGSGSTKEEITTAVKNGVIKMNVDTDTQWAYWDGLRMFYKKNEAYLQGQVGNPEGEDKPNKKFYDPRVWVRAAEESMIKRAQESLTVLGNLTQNLLIKKFYFPFFTFFIFRDLLVKQMLFS